MKPISTILTLLVLVLPIIAILTVFTLTILTYRTSFDASAILDSISALISLVLVNLLVWERLRDSLSKKMNYLEDNIFLDLHSLFENDFDLWYNKQREIESLRIDLGRYGKFLIIRLFPIKLLKKIDDFLLLYKKFLGNVEQIMGIAKQNSPSIDYDKLALFHHLGFDVWYSKPSEEKEKEIIAAAQSIEKKEQIASETEVLHEKVKKMRKQIFEELEEFLKCNNLRTTPEPVKVVSSFS
jgi:hypothetical protein